MDEEKHDKDRHSFVFFIKVINVQTKWHYRKALSYAIIISGCIFHRFSGFNTFLQYISCSYDMVLMQTRQWIV